MPPETLYHYTTAAGLLGIIQSARLWATDVRFLNDAEDAIYGRDALVEAIRGLPDRTTADWNAFRDLVGRVVENSPLVSRMYNTSVYVSCFCESGDLLSQWRAYGSDHGYALGFDARALDALDSGGFRTSSLSAVRYGVESAHEVIAEALSRVGREATPHPSGTSARDAALDINAMLARIKNPAFVEEREWRLIRALRSLPYSTEVLFRSSAIAVIPYIAIPFPLAALRSVRVGPGTHAETRAAGVRRLLERVHSVATVELSAIPLRS